MAEQGIDSLQMQMEDFPGLGEENRLYGLLICCNFLILSMLWFFCGRFLTNVLDDLQNSQIQRGIIIVCSARVRYNGSFREEGLDSPGSK